MKSTVHLPALEKSQRKDCVMETRKLHPIENLVILLCLLCGFIGFFMGIFIGLHQSNGNGRLENDITAFAETGQYIFVSECYQSKTMDCWLIVFFAPAPNSDPFICKSKDKLNPGNYRALLGEKGKKILTFVDPTKPPK